MAACRATQWRPVHQKGENGWEKSLRGVWYRLYGKLFVCQTGPRAVQAVLQLHPALDLLYHRTVRQSVRIPEFWPTVLGVLLLGVV